MHIVGLSPPRLSLPNLKMPVHSFITDLEPFNSPVSLALPGYTEVHVGESYKFFLPTPHSKGLGRGFYVFLVTKSNSPVSLTAYPSHPGEARLPLEQVCRPLCSLSPTDHGLFVGLALILTC